MAGSAPPSYIYPHSNPERVAELRRKFGSTIAKYNPTNGGGVENLSQKRASAPPPIDHVSVSRLRRKLSARELARRDIAAMGKTVEISDGTGDFGRLMAAEFGKSYDERVWRFAKDVFVESTGLRLIEEEDE